MEYLWTSSSTTLDFEYFLIFAVRHELQFLFYYNRARLRRFPTVLYSLNNNKQKRPNRPIGDYYLNPSPNLRSFIFIIMIKFEYESYRCKQTRKLVGAIAH
ncbi:hypothetical protein HZS_6552 [Henneguya salminicola]|nr:hypothetical protein HZS_6552 [Henneguya salminicola]